MVAEPTTSNGGNIGRAIWTSGDHRSRRLGDLPVTAASETGAVGPRAVIVTGASSGIGRATAERLAIEGHRVVMGARRTEDCEMLAKHLREQGANAYALPLDLSDVASVEGFATASSELIGAAEVLVSNAGQSQPMKSTSADTDSFRSVLDVNLIG